MQIKKRALITGIGGQDGSYLAEHLLKLDYEVHGIVRRTTGFANLRSIIKNPSLKLHSGDMLSAYSLDVALRKSMPCEIYNLAGQTFVPTSWQCPSDTFDVNTIAFNNLLDLVSSICPKAKVYQASTSEMFGNNPGVAPLNEETLLRPESPYGVSKLASHELCRVYRNRGLYVVSGILFNHESPRRGPEMVTRKITMAVARWASGSNEILELGNLTSCRDWGYAGDYVKAMHLMLQQVKPRDLVIGTGVSTSIKEFLIYALHSVQLPVEEFIDNNVRLSDSLNRPNEVKKLIADYSLASATIGWTPEVDVKSLAAIMVGNERNHAN